MHRVTYLILLVQFLAFTCFSESRSFKSRNRRMINGNPASITEWPFIASLKYSRTSNLLWKICSASLITRRWLVTVAHCVKDPADKTINANDLNVQLRIRYDSWQTQDYEVSEIVVHSIRSAEDVLGNLENDIALIKLKEDAPAPVRTVQMYQQGTGTVLQCRSAGWGSTSQLQNGEEDINNGNYRISSSLKKITVPDLVGWRSCDFLSLLGTVDLTKNHKFFCGGKESASGNNAQYACIGDSGSPLICQNNYETVLYGLLVGGNGRCIPRSQHIIFIDVGKHRQWINQIVYSAI